MIEFLAMGGYAKYVWPSYIIVALLFSYLYFAPIFERRKLIRDLRRESRNHSSKQQAEKNTIS